MTQDEIIEMARHAGAVPIGFNKTTMQKEYSIFFNELEAFAKLVAAKEREACAAIVREWVKAYPHPSGIIANNIMARGEV